MLWHRALIRWVNMDKKYRRELIAWKFMCACHSLWDKLYFNESEEELYCIIFHLCWHFECKVNCNQPDDHCLFRSISARHTDYYLSLTSYTFFCLLLAVFIILFPFFSTAPYCSACRETKIVLKDISPFVPGGNAIRKGKDPETGGGSKQFFSSQFYLFFWKMYFFTNVQSSNFLYDQKRETRKTIAWNNDIIAI